MATIETLIAQIDDLALRASAVIAGVGLWPRW